MIQLPRSFLLATSPATTATIKSTASFYLLPKSSTSSALQIIPFMDKCRTLHLFPGTCITPLPIQTSDTHRKGSLFKLKNIRLTSTKTTRYTKVRPDIYTTIRSCGDGFKYASNIQPQSRVRFLKCVGPVDIFGNEISASGVRLNFTKCRAFSDKSFSQVPSGTNKIDGVGCQNTSTLQGFNKLKKQKKAISVQRKIRAADSSISNNVETEASSVQMLGGRKDNMDLGSLLSGSPVGSDKPVTKVDGKKKPRSKKGKKQKSSAEAQVSKSSKVTSKATSASNNKRGPDLMQITELNSTGYTPSKEADSTPTRLLSNKKGGNSSRKGNSVKAASEKLPKHTTIDVSKVKTRGRMPTKMLPTGKSVVVVESVTKARVIQGYLGDMFEVLPSYGHIRDLAARSGSVRPDDDFSMVWEVPSAAWTHLKSIKVALNGAKNLILASDPDREGEAIAWHIIEMLQQQDALCDDVTVARVVFHEITESSIKNALKAPREIDVNLVHAYLARRALDYLIGFNVSPLLWRKLPGCQSAGRVQSAALALICDREMEIDEFKPQEYWTVDIELNKKELGLQVNVNVYPAHLTHFDSKKLNQFSISSHTQAKDVEQQLNIAELLVLKSKVNKTRKNPPTPYITSTLQQDAANKLNFSSTYTMKLAQKLYEGIQLSDCRAAGLITYTRTDGLHISDEAVNNIRSLVIERYGQEFASGSPRKYFKKVKNAQEAHEAIRPTDISRLPSMLTGILDEDSLKLYTLIWCRTVACQMEPATIEQIQVDLGNAIESIVFRSSCSRIEFPGYQSVFKDVEAEPIRDKENQGNDRDEAFKVLRSLQPGDPLHLRQVELKEHYTQPPPRYSEGSLVKKLEELGIGRPSTYASTIKVLQDRNYVTVKSRVLHPEFRGRMVSAFLCHHFSEVTDYSFTADMETELDNVSAGLTDWKGLLRDYWTRFSSYCGRASNVHIHEVEKMLEKKFGDFLFTSLPEKSRVCPSCMEGTLIFKVSRFGAGYFIGCDQNPKCKYIAKTLYDDDEEKEAPRDNNMDEPKVLGVNPGSGEKVLLKSGPYGFYVQLGEDRKGYQPKRASVSHIKDVDSITLEGALELIRYPITLGNHPDDGQPVILKLAKVGFVVRHRRNMATAPKNLKAKDITLEKALELLSGKDVRRLGRPKGKAKGSEDFEEVIEAM